jgi:hypothetical protein
VIYRTYDQADIRHHDDKVSVIFAYPHWNTQSTDRSLRVILVVVDLDLFIYKMYQDASKLAKTNVKRLLHQYHFGNRKFA